MDPTTNSTPTDNTSAPQPVDPAAMPVVEPTNPSDPAAMPVMDPPVTPPAPVSEAPAPAPAPETPAEPAAPAPTDQTPQPGVM